MANIKFSAFTQKVVTGNVDFLVGYTGADNVRISPAIFSDTYLPLAGGTLTGTLTINNNTPLIVNGIDPLISFQNASTNHWQVGLENTNSDRFIFYDNNAAAYQLILESTSGNATFAGNILIGTSTTTPSVHYDNLVIEDVAGNNVGISLISSNANNTALYFGDADDVDVGQLKYSHSTNDMFFITNAVTALTIDSTQNVIFAQDATIGGKTYPKLNLLDNQGVARNFSIGTNNETFTLRNETGSADALTIAGADNSVTFAAQVEVDFVEATGTNKRMLFLDYNPTNNSGSGYIEIAGGSNSEATTQIEQVTSGGSGQYGTYLDTNFINKGLSASAHGNINFVTGSNTSASSVVMTIGGGTQKGNVGIGVADPENTLQINHAANPTSIRIGDNTTDDCFVIFNTDGNDWSIGTDRSDSNTFKISDYSALGTNDRFEIDTSGNIKINGDTSINRNNETGGELLLGGTTDGGFVDFDSTNLQLNTQRDPNTGTFINAAKSQATIQLLGPTGGSSIKFGTAAADNTVSTTRMTIDSSGNITQTGAYTDQNGVRTFNQGGVMVNNISYDIDITVDNDTGTGTVHHITAMMTHFSTTYGCVLDCYAYTRGTGVDVQTDLLNQSTAGAGGWTVSKPDTTTLRLTKSAGTYTGAGNYQVVVVTRTP